MINNFLTVIEDKTIKTINLDDKSEWTVGRPSKNNVPDIKLHSITVSRKHGYMHTSDGLWIYIDEYGKNGTVYKRAKFEDENYIKYKSEKLEKKNGKIKPIILDNNDVLIFGGGISPVVDHRTVFALYTTDFANFNWRIIETKGIEHMTVVNDGEENSLDNLQKGDVFRGKHGIVIYMGDVIYITGGMELKYN